MALILDSNQPALITCRAGIGLAGVCRALALIDIRNLDTSDSDTKGKNLWSRFRAINPAHNATPDTASWTTVREV